jgi:myo-inositol 2-dehydrogenase / D-chiro-inositol 1-dehydrogenase
MMRRLESFRARNDHAAIGMVLLPVKAETTLREEPGKFWLKSGPARHYQRSPCPGTVPSILDGPSPAHYPLPMQSNSVHDSRSPLASANRRRFLKASGVLAFGGILVGDRVLSGRAFAANADTLRVGLIGCGGRGTGAANNALRADPNTILTAMADVFEDRLNNSLQSLTKEHGDRVKVDPDHRFVGFDGYRKVIDSGVDVVLLATPPGFRPYHLKAAVAAGKHVFSEKPMAVDAPGVRTVLEVAEQARRKRLALVSGFCWRYNAGERAIMQRIHDGAIGQPLSLQNTYNTGPIWVNRRRPEWTDMQYQMRNWYYYGWLSGDHITEQAVHSLDKMAWAMQDVPPERCVAHGGRQVRTGDEFGHIFDHFSVVYEYENGARGYHFCRQQPGCANDNSDYFIGSNGVARIHAFGPLVISGANPWRFRGDRPDMYQVELDEMIASIRAGTPINDGVWMAHSTLLAIMGRMAAYTGQIVTWEQALHSNEDLVKFALKQDDRPGDPRFDWDLNLRVPPVAMPGRTPLV